MTKRRSLLEQLLTSLFEISAAFWPVAALLSAVFVIGSGCTLRWGLQKFADGLAVNQQAANMFADPFGWICVLLPVLLALLGLIFAGAAWNGYWKQGRF